MAKQLKKHCTIEVTDHWNITLTAKQKKHYWNVCSFKFNKTVLVREITTVPCTNQQIYQEFTIFDSWHHDIATDNATTTGMCYNTTLYDDRSEGIAFWVNPDTFILTHLQTDAWFIHYHKKSTARPSTCTNIAARLTRLNSSGTKLIT